MPLPRFIGPDGAIEARTQGLATTARFRSEGRRVRAGAAVRAMYLTHDQTTVLRPLYHVDDTEQIAPAGRPA